MNQHNERAELKPCPFCGGQATFDHDDNGWNWIVCKNCGACTNARVSAMDDCKPLLAEQWNRRAAMLEAQRPALKPMTDEQKQAMRLYKAVERLALQAGEDTDESVDWLCGEHGGMFKLYEAYFSPKKPDGTCPTCESLSRAVMADHVFHDKLTKPLTDERLEEMWEADTTSSEDCKSLYFFKLVARAIEAAHGIKEQA